jgi:hypothetical protein
MKILLRFLAVCLIALVALSFAVEVSTVEDSANICHGNECYPRVFVPTEEFQMVREGQEIPKGIDSQGQF